mgnify:CR=1 FL=1
MVKYSCERCGKEFSQKSHYDSHKKRKRPCVNNVDKIKELVDKAVEKKLKDFIDGEIKILITTTIVEAGLDIQEANTMIINNYHIIQIIN